MIKEKKPKNKIQKPQWMIKQHRYVMENKKKVTIVSALLGAGFVAIILILSTYTNLYPYEVIADGNTLGYIRGKEATEQIMYKVVEEFIPEESQLKAVDTGGRLKIKKAETFNVNKKDVITVNEAVEEITKTFSKKDKDLPEFKIASLKDYKEKFEPEPHYKKDDTMLAGDSRVAKKGKKGTRITTRLITSINGKVISEEDVSYKVIKQGKRATVYKGTLGLPDGKNWKTYTGDPIFKDGAELVKTAKKYLGAPYRYGGKSLTNGIDCVAFVVQIYKKYGINLPYSHSGIQHRGKGVSLKNAKKGDVICYNGHMAIYIGNNKIVEAVRSGVRVKTGASYRKIKTIRRIVE